MAIKPESDAAQSVARVLYNLRGPCDDRNLYAVVPSGKISRVECRLKHDCMKKHDCMTWNGTCFAWFHQHHVKMAPASLFVKWHLLRLFAGPGRLGGEITGAIVVQQIWGDAFYHWMIECLPRLAAVPAHALHNPSIALLVLCSP
jgi:hypothetical protein